MRQYSYFTCLLLLSLTACRKDLFEPDPANAKLPAYTEKGNDVAGCLINGDVWRSAYTNSLLQLDNGLRISAYDEGSELTVSFRGDMKTGAQRGQNVELTFKLVRVSSAVFTLDSLSGLHNRRFLLSGIDQQASTYGIGAHQEYRNGRGELFVRRVQRKESANVFVNGQPLVQYILSGTFSFTAFVGTDSVQVKEGRFDQYVSRLR